MKINRYSVCSNQTVYNIQNVVCTCVYKSYGMLRNLDISECWQQLWILLLCECVLAPIGFCFEYVVASIWKTMITFRRWYLADGRRGRTLKVVLALSHDHPISFLILSQVSRLFQTLLSPGTELLCSLGFPAWWTEAFGNSWPNNSLLQ